MATVSTSTKLPAFERFVAYRRFGAGLAFTRDGAHVLFVSNMSGQFNLWRVPVDGGWPDQLTSFTEQTVRLIAVSPKDDTIVLCADRDGDEFHQLFVLDPAEGWPEQITDAPEVQHFVGGSAFSPDGTKLAYSAERPHADGRRGVDPRSGVGRDTKPLRRGDVRVRRRLVAGRHEAARR